MVDRVQAMEQRHQSELQQERQHHQTQLAKARGAQVPPWSTLLPRWR